jgi:hypothetical protein
VTLQRSIWYAECDGVPERLRKRAANKAALLRKSAALPTDLGYVSELDGRVGQSSHHDALGAVKLPRVLGCLHVTVFLLFIAAGFVPRVAHRAGMNFK